MLFQKRLLLRHDQQHRMSPTQRATLAVMLGCRLMSLEFTFRIDRLFKLKLRSFNFNSVCILEVICVKTKLDSTTV